MIRPPQNKHVSLSLSLSPPQVSLHRSDLSPETKLASARLLFRLVQRQRATAGSHELFIAGRTLIKSNAAERD